MTRPETPQEELIVRLGRDHRLAHQTLFAHRHPDETPPFHYEIIDDLHSDKRRVLELAFRGAAKSTIAEEYIAIDACYRRFRNFILLARVLREHPNGCRLSRTNSILTSTCAPCSVISTDPPGTKTSLFCPTAW